MPFDSFCSDWCKWSLQSVRWSTAQIHNKKNQSNFRTYNGERGHISHWVTMTHIYGAYKKEREKNHGHGDEHTPMEGLRFLTFWAGAWACQLLECDSFTHTQTNTHEHTHIYRVLIHVKRILRFHLCLVYKYNVVTNSFLLQFHYF